VLKVIHPDCWGEGGQREMARAYSNDLRERVAAAVGSGWTCREVAALFNVSVASVVKWSQRYRVTGSAAAHRMGRTSQPRALAAHRDWLLQRLQEKPDLTLRALVVELHERGIKASRVSIWRVLKEAGHSFKKTYSRPSKTGQKQRAGARNGANIKGALIPSAWFLSMKPGPRQIRPRCAAGGGAWAKADCQGATRSLENLDLSCCSQGPIQNATTRQNPPYLITYSSLISD
jgi:transposase